MQIKIATFDPEGSHPTIQKKEGNHPKKIQGEDQLIQTWEHRNVLHCAE